MSTSRILVIAALAASTATLLAGCAGTASTNGGDPGGSAPAPAERAELGTWSSDDGSAWVTLADGDQVTGNDGCNAVKGTYTTDDDTVTFDMGIMTLKACLGVTLSFYGLTSGAIDDDRLTLFDADGGELAVLTRD